MAHTTMSDADIFFNGIDISGDSNELAINYSCETIEDSAFGDTTKSRLAGLKVIVIDVNGFWDAANPDLEIFDNVGAADSIITICPTGGEDGEVGFFNRSVVGAYNLKGQIGQNFAYNFHAEGSNPKLIKGTMLLGKATKTASNSGTAYELGAVAAGQTVYGVLHCFSASAGDTLDVIVQSDNLEAFGDPTTQLTFTQVSGGTAASNWQSKAGAIADTWWRVNWTIAGADPSFSFAVCVGIV